MFNEIQNTQKKTNKTQLGLIQLQTNVGQLGDKLSISRRRVVDRKSYTARGTHKLGSK